MADKSSHFFYQTLLSAFSLFIMLPLSVGAQVFPPLPSVLPATNPTQAREQADRTRTQEEIDTLEELRATDEETAWRECLAEYRPHEPDTPDGGQFVPVHETGELLRAGRNVEISAGLSAERLNLICQYLNAIWAVQYQWETKAFITDPALRRDAATALDEYQRNLTAAAETGRPASIRTTAQTGGSNPPQPNQGGRLDPDLKSYKQEEAMRAAGTFIAKASSPNSPDPYKEQTIASLQRDILPNINNLPQPGDYKDFLAGKSSGDQFWKDLNNYLDIVDNDYANPAVAYMTSREKLQIAVENAEHDAETELLIGGGYLPSREPCVEWSEPVNGASYCITKGEVVRTGNAIGAAINEALAAQVKLYEQSELSGIVSPNNDPNPATILEGNTASQPVGGGAPNYQGNSRLFPDFNFADLPGFPGAEDDDDNNGGGGDNPSPTAPRITLAHNRDTTTAPNKINLTWSTAAANACKATTDWVGTPTDITLPPLLTRLYQSEQGVPTNGSRLIYVPISFNFSLEKNGEVFSGANILVTNDPKATTTNVFWRIDGSTIKKDDEITIRLSAGAGIPPLHITVGGLGYFPQESAAARRRSLINLISTDIASRAPTDPLIRYYTGEIIYDQDDPIGIKLAPKTPRYGLSCTNQGEQSASIISL